MDEKLENNSWLLQTIVAKSDQLNAVDLVGGSQTYKVAKVSKCEGEQPVAIELDDPKRPYKPCKSMRRVLIACWGANPVLWIGRQMTLFCDPNVKWGGESVGGIRISHLSNLDVPKRDVQLNESRHKKTTWTVFNIETKVEAERIANATKAISGCKTQDQLAKVWKQCEPLYAACDDEQKNVLDSARSEKAESFNEAAS